VERVGRKQTSQKVREAFHDEQEVGMHAKQYLNIIAR
jgi:hypothetical protein